MARDKRNKHVWDRKERRAPAQVLVVNDDTDACELLVRILGAAGFRAEGVPSADAAIASMLRLLPRCVVLDLTAGGIGSSLKVLDQIRSHEDRRISSARAVLIATSAKNRSFSFQSGVDAYLTRPFHADELVRHVTDVVDRPDEERARHRRDELQDSPS